MQAVLAGRQFTKNAADPMEMARIAMSTNPHGLLSDNGPTFTSAEFTRFVNNRGIKHTFTPPYHSASNGVAENMVGTFKDKIAKMIKSGRGLDKSIIKFLLDYRTTPHATTKVTPASLMYRRELRTTFSLLRPSIATQEERQQTQINNVPKTKDRNFCVGKEVMVKDFRKEHPDWSRTRIVEQSSPVTFAVVMDNDVLTKLHVNQMRKECVEDKEDARKGEVSTERSETFSPIS
ncbi:hypothetical protein RF55_8593 [Lasius niger]|uniref:Integrase catalytic domain-containing protein n=1 Tax=Lasius niger TaxID=67767 RepID=A0A0J7NG24_LASNI|nr:hypothetical protein RF55_8593 [Lasius niger]